MKALPRILLCAPSSGAGKTTFVCALLRAFLDRGRRPAAFKSGPDYIDPMFHREIAGADAGNLDLFLMGEEAVRAELLTTGARASLAVIEGAMGYYDGIAMGEEASAYDLARRTQTPAVLILDAKGQALSAAAVAKGMAAFRADANIRALLLNRVSPMGYPRLKTLLETETGLPVCGFLPEAPECSFESRHLGLVTAAETGALREKLAALSALARRYVDLDALEALAAAAPPLAEPLPIPRRTVGRPRIALARDKAFCFYYPSALALLERLGAELVPFSPLADGALPEGTAGLYLGGGYPELHARALSENASLRASVRRALEDGTPTIAECGGFLYLHESIEDEDGAPWPMCGVIPARARRTGRLQRFGYITMTARADGLLGPAGTALPAHEFHYWESEAPGAAFRAEKPQSARGWDCAYHTPALYAGFPHFHLCAAPGAAARFVAACEEYRKKLDKRDETVL